MHPLWLLIVVCGAFGLAIGSFLNVVIYRVPRKESIVTPPSACPSCGTELADGGTIAGRRQLDDQTISICKSCGEIIMVMKVRDQLALRTISAREYLGLNETAQLTLRVAFELVCRQQGTQLRALRQLH